MNRKGATSLGVLVLVIMALALSGAALFSFLVSDKVQEQISGVGFMENVYAKEEKIRFYADNEIFVSGTYSEKLGLENAVKLIEGAELIGEKIEIRSKLLSQDTIDDIMLEVSKMKKLSENEKKEEIKRRMGEANAKIEIVYRCKQE